MDVTASRKKVDSTVFWWIGWIALTIVSFFLSSFFWTDFIAKRFGSVHKPGIAILWVAAVFGSWMILLVPLIIVMYAKVDKAYEDARLAREKRVQEKKVPEFGAKSILIEREKRLLDQALVQKLKRTPPSIPHGHLITVILKDGRKIKNVFVKDRRELLGIYEADSLPFEGRDILDFEPADLDALPAFKAEGWLRLDGVGGGD